MEGGWVGKGGAAIAGGDCSFCQKEKSRKWNSYSKIQKSFFLLFASFLIAAHPYLEKTFGLKLLSIKDTQLLLMVVIHGKIWDHFWNFRFSLSQENWGQRKLMCEKVGFWEKENFSYLSTFYQIQFCYYVLWSNST